ncbi:MAG: hypothetical protein H6621_07950 [Halobacteriovoraceae bacterium]|nr:hypothetical protein [Halobacteriovoraceae bacterium]
MQLQVTEVISGSASIFSISSMGIYFINLTKGKSIPNPATWITWLVIGLINLLTYFYLANGNFLKALPLLFVVGGIILVAVYSSVNGKFARLSTLDMICLAVALVVGVFWQISGNPQTANLLLQIVYVISFIPTVNGLRKKEIFESSPPWILAVIAYSLMIVGIIMSWGQSSWIELVHPIFNGILGNGLVAYYSLIK